MADIFENVQRIALLGVLQPDEEAHLRRIFRWYSKTFHTPLHEIDDIPLEYILLNYFESNYEELEEDKLKEQLLTVIETPEERLRREAEEEADEDAFMKQLEEEAAQEKAKIKAKKLQRSPLKVKPPVDIAVNEEMLEEPQKAPEEPEIKINISEGDLFDEIGEMDFIPSKPSK